MGLKTIPSMNPQFQAQYDEEQRKMELAKALMAQSQKSPLDYLEQPRTAQMAKLGLGPAIAPLIQAITGGLTARNAQQGMAGAQQANANEVSQGQAEFNSNPDKKAAIAKMIASMNPGLQAFGREQQMREDDRLKTVAEMQAKISAPDAIATYLAGDPNMARGSQFPEPTVSSAPGPDGRSVPYLVNTMEGGRKQGTSIGLPSNVSVAADAKLQQAEGEDLIRANVKGLEEGKKAALEAQASLANSSRVIDGLERGAKVGGGQGWLQSGREWAKTFFGVDIPETGITATTSAALGQGVLTAIRAYAPVTEYDEKKVSKIVGSIDTDPAALPTLMAYQAAKAIKAIQDYETQHGKLAADSKFGNLYDALGTGASMPQVLRGPLPWKMQVLQEVQLLGGNPVPLLKAMDPSFKEKDGIPTFDFSGGPITPKADIAKALADREREAKKGNLPPGVRRSR